MSFSKPLLPKSFLNRMRNELGNEFQAFVDSFSFPANISIRLNPLKPTQSFGQMEKVPWNSYGRYLQTRPDFVFDPLIHAGAYYVQEPSSMIFANAIDFSKDLMILDLCASPGGKSTLLLSEMSENSLLFSNEIVRKRSAILYENLVKWGYPNVVVTSNSPEEYHDFTGAFDVVVVDAPCSGEGMFRKDPETIGEWRENKPFQCSIAQKNILDQAVHLVKDEGLLIYMTCTYSIEENEQIVNWFLKKYSQRARLKKIDFDPDWGITEKIIDKTEDHSVVYRCYPHKVRGEGMFIAVFIVNNPKKSFFSPKKTESVKNLSIEEQAQLKQFYGQHHRFSALKDGDKIMLWPEKYLPEIMTAYRKLNVLKAGVHAANISSNKHKIIPTHESALSTLISYPVKIELNLSQALAYLKKTDISISTPDDQLSTWFLASYQGINLGWLKKSAHHLNNFYPKEWAIRKSIPVNINELTNNY